MNLTDIRILIEKQRRAGLNPVDLSTGALLIPPSEKSLNLIEETHIKRLNYTTSIGTHNIRADLAKVLSKQFGYALEADQIALVSGGTEAVFLSTCATEQYLWIHTRPGWHTFDEICRILGKNLLHWEYRQQSFDAFCHQKIIENNAGLFINTPINPTGDLIYSEQIFNKRRIFLIFDLTYLGMTLENSNKYFDRIISYGLENLEHTCLIFSLSKLFRIPGLRLGFVITDAKLISRIATVKSALTLNMPCDFQDLLVNLWKNKDEEINSVHSYLNTRNSWLREVCIKQNIKPIEKQSTHYRVIDLGENYETFISELANKGIFVAPCKPMGLPCHARINISCNDSDIIAFINQLALLNK